MALVFARRSSMQTEKRSDETDAVALATRIGPASEGNRKPSPVAFTPALFGRFADTGVEGFREQFVRPLLVRLGYQGISNRHGCKDFGRDYVVSERNALGQSRQLLILAEHAERLSQPAQAERLLTRVRQCFLTSYTLPTVSNEARSVAAIYLFNSGRIADELTAHLYRSLAKTMAANLHFLDGERLAWLADHLSQRHDADARTRLEALIVQLRLNEHIWDTLRKGIACDGEPPTWDMRGGLLNGLEDFLTHPLLPDKISPVEVATLWQRAKTIQAIAMRGYLTLAAPSARAKDLKLLAAVCHEAIRTSAALRERIAQVLAELTPSMI